MWTKEALEQAAGAVYQQVTDSQHRRFVLIDDGGLVPCPGDEEAHRIATKLASSRLWLLLETEAAGCITFSIYQWAADNSFGEFVAALVVQTDCELRYDFGLASSKQWGGGLELFAQASHQLARVAGKLDLLLRNQGWRLLEAEPASFDHRLIEDLQLPPRPYNLLKGYGVQTIGQLVEMVKQGTLREVPGLGELGQRRVKEALKSGGYLSNPKGLSDRELAVLQLLPTTLKNGEIAEQLFVSVNTVKSHLKQIYGKLDVHSREEAVAQARALNLLARPTSAGGVHIHPIE